MPRIARLATALFAFAFLCTSSSGQAIGNQEMDRIKNVRFAVNGNNLRVVVETEHAPPQGSAYFLTGPERLIIELNDALPGTSLGAPPRLAMIQSWGLKQTNLNRTQLVFNLTHRPVHSDLKVQTLANPHRFSVDIPIDPYWKEEFTLTKGVTWVREDQYLAGLWVRLNRLVFNPKDPEIQVVLGLAQEKVSARETVSSMVRRNGALAGINAGFFAASGGALGLVYRDGKLLAPHVQRRPPRTGFGVTLDGTPLIGRLASNGPSFKDLDGGDWSKASMAVGGGPRLMKDGSSRITAKEEELGPGGNDITRVAGRSLAATFPNGKMMLSTVSGFRDNHSQGAKFEPTVQWLQKLGVKDAVNFDGGASVDMVIGEHIVSDGPGNVTKEKPVATAVLVKDSREKLYPSSATWTLSNATLPADGKSAAQVTVSFTTASGAPVPDGTPVRFFSHGVMLSPGAAKTSGGQATAQLTSVRRAGAAKLTVMCGPVTSSKELSLTRGEPERMLVKLLDRKKTKTADQRELLRVNAKVLLTDAWGNPSPNEEFTVAVDGSQPFGFRTDERGMSNLEVDTALTGGRLTVFHSRAGEIPLSIPPLP